MAKIKQEEAIAERIKTAGEVHDDAANMGLYTANKLVKDKFGNLSS